VVTDAPTNTQTHRQDRLIYTAQQLSGQCNDEHWWHQDWEGYHWEGYCGIMLQLPFSTSLTVNTELRPYNQTVRESGPGALE